jgi:uncharacterized protein YukE
LLTAAIFSLGAYVASSAQESAAKGQNPAPAATAPSADPSTKTGKTESTEAKPTPKPKKVWTNDDMAELHENSTVSVVGTRQGNAQPKSYYSPPPGQAEYMVKMYRQQIDQLQAQANAIDKQIANLQDAKNGKTVDSTRTYDPWGGKTGDWNAQIQQLAKSKEDVLKQIDQIQQQIRKINP